MCAVDSCRARFFLARRAPGTGRSAFRRCARARETGLAQTQLIVVRKLRAGEAIGVIVVLERHVAALDEIFPDGTFFALDEARHVCKFAWGTSRASHLPVVVFGPVFSKRARLAGGLSVRCGVCTDSVGASWARLWATGEVVVDRFCA